MRGVPQVVDARVLEDGMEEVGAWLVAEYGDGIHHFAHLGFEQRVGYIMRLVFQSLTGLQGLSGPFPKDKIVVSFPNFEHLIIPYLAK